MERLLRLKLRDGRFAGVTPERSLIMSAVRPKGNKATERALRMAFVRAGIIGWRLHASDLPGCPDFYFPVCRLAIFVDGCFWHGCPRCGHVPKTNEAFWALKIKRNRQRDANTRVRLRRQGIRVLRFWEHQLKDGLALCVTSVSKQIGNASLTRLNTKMTTYKHARHDRSPS